MATHSGIFAWEIPWTEESGRLHAAHGFAKSQTRLSMHECNYPWGSPLGVVQPVGLDKCIMMCTHH